ncbi:Krueppel-like factor 7 [Pitangus sulphuratus]|nr:Krueppel-like factor 7 [Pitangus sulphuratus]
MDQWHCQCENNELLDFFLPAFTWLATVIPICEMKTDERALFKSLSAWIEGRIPLLFTLRLSYPRVKTNLKVAINECLKESFVHFSGLCHPEHVLKCVSVRDFVEHEDCKEPGPKPCAVANDSTDQQTCLELERYLQTEPRRISETFGEELDCFLHASSAPDAEDNIRQLDPILLPVETSTCDKSATMDIILSRDKLLSETCLSSQSTSSSTEGYTAVNQAQLNAVTSLTPPSSPELSRHLVKTSQTLSAVDGTVTLKLVAKKTSLSSVKVGVATATAGAIKSGQSDSEQGGTGTEASPENKKRVHRCQFNGCRKVYTKSSHLKAHQRTHTDTTPMLLLELKVMILTQPFLKFVRDVTQ